MLMPNTVSSMQSIATQGPTTGLPTSSAAFSITVKHLMLLKSVLPSAMPYFGVTCTITALSASIASVA